MESNETNGQADRACQNNNAVDPNNNTNNTTTTNNNNNATDCNNDNGDLNTRPELITRGTTQQLQPQPQQQTAQDVHTREKLFDFIALLQGRRMDDQRATLKPSS